MTYTTLKANPRKVLALTGLTPQEFELLLEGAPANHHASRRDVCAGIAFTAAVGLIGIYLTAEYVHDKTPQMSAWMFTMLLLAVTLAAGALASFAHRDSKKQGRSAYAYCVQRIEQRFGPAVAPESLDGCIFPPRPPNKWPRFHSRQAREHRAKPRPVCR